MKLKMLQNDFYWEEIRDFIIVFWGNGLDSEGVKSLLRRHYQMKPDYIIRSIYAGKKILEVAEYDEFLLNLVTCNVNEGLKQNTNEMARKWLEEALQITEEIVLEKK